MSFTLYASFQDVLMAEKAAGALLDHGVRSQDMSLVANDAARGARLTPPVAAPVDSPSPVAAGGDMAIYETDNRAPAKTNIAEERAATRDHAAAEQAAAAGFPAAAASYEAAAERHDAAADGKVTAVGAPSVSVPPGGSPVPPNTSPPIPVPPLSAAVVDPVTGAPVADPGLAPAVPPDSDRRPADPDFAAKGGLTTTTAADAEIGAVRGAGIGLGLGLLAGLAVIVVPGFGLVVGGGALAMALGAAAGTTAAGAIAGGVTGFLRDQGVPEQAAQRYQNTVELGGAMLAVRLPSGPMDSGTAEHLLAKYNAYDIKVF